MRVVAAGADGDRRWQGFVERLTGDSLYLRLLGTDSIAAFSRNAIRSVERRNPSRPGRAVGIGCLALGGALGALGYFGTHDPDSPGLEKTAGVLGLAAGCGLGAVGGLVVSAVRHRDWEPWILPDQLP